MAHQRKHLTFHRCPRLWWGFLGMALLLCTTVAGAAPTNDDIAQATVITALPFTHGPLDTTAATTTPADPSCAGRSHTVWYTFTPTTNFSMTVNTIGSNYDTTVSVYTGTPGALTPLACNDDYKSLQSQVVFQAHAGTTYYIMVGSYDSGPGGRLLFHVVGIKRGPPSANDDIAQATVITALPFTDGPLNTTGATTAPADPSCSGRSHTVWYVVTPTADLSMIVHTFGSDYDTTVSVYAGTPGTLTPLACTDDTLVNWNLRSLQSQVVFQAHAGTTYYIMVGSYGSGPGGRLLFWAVEPAPLEASVFGIIPQTAVCKNISTGRQVTLSEPAPTWDCEAAGLAVHAGDTVTIQVLGTVEEAATDVGGAVTGMAPLSGSCTNVTTGQQVQFQDMLGAREVSCVAAGLVVQPGETVQMRVKGVAE